MARTETTWVVEQICWLLRQNPGGAVLLDGPWGVGKTHLWESSIRPNLQKQKREPVYLSLYGVTSVQQFNELIIAARLPFMKSTGGQAVIKAVKAAAEMFRASQALTLAELWDLDPTTHVLCIDDLERCDGEALPSVMGHLTQLVERKRIPLLLLGNEHALATHEIYPRIREKLIGYTFAFPTDVEMAVSAIVDGVAASDGPLRAYLSARKGLIRQVLERSPSLNFRALKVALYKFATLYAKLHEHRVTDGDVDRILRLVVGLCQDVSRDAAVRRDLEIGLTQSRIRLGIPLDQVPDSSLLRFQHQYFEPWLDTPPELPQIVSFVLNGAMPAIDEASLLPLQQPPDRDRRVARFLHRDAGMQAAEVQQAVNELLADPERFHRTVNDVLRTAELLEDLVAQHVITQTWPSVEQSLSAAIDGIAAATGRAIADLNSDAFLCGFEPGLGSHPGLASLRTRARDQTVKARDNVYDAAFVDIFGELGRNPHLVQAFVERMAPWLRTIELFTDELVPRIVPYLADCSDVGVQAFVRFVRDRSPRAIERYRSHISDYDELKGLRSLVAQLRSTADAATGWRRMAIANNSRMLEYTIERLEKDQ